MLKRGQKLSRRDFTARTIAGAFPVGAVAQTAWPQRPIRFIVPNAAGRSVDTICRVVANQLSAILRQAIVVDNRAGAAGAIGIEAGRSAAPDGYSLIIAFSSSITVAPLLLKVATYKPLVDFDFIALIELLPGVLVCTPDINVKTTAELISYAKSKSGKTNMASPGNGSASQLTGWPSTTPPVLNRCMCPTEAAALGLEAAGRLRLLGHSTVQDARPLGPVPSLAETVHSFEFTSWIGLMAPKGPPPQIAATLRRASVTALLQPALRESFESNGAVPIAESAADFRSYLTRDIARTRRAIQVGSLQSE